MDARIFAVFTGAESTVALAARYMADHNLTPREVVAAYDAWLAGRTPAPPQAAPRRSANPGREAVESRIVRACPKCGGTVYLRKLCPKVSPKWRTQLACENAACDWHGLSELLLPDLLATGAAGIKQHVQEG